MKAVLLETFGAPESFSIGEIPTPAVRPGHVLIRVAASSVNPIDARIRQGLMPNLAPPAPVVLHGDVAGTVEAVGEGVTKFRPGDEVYGLAGGFKGFGGALAEYMLADAELIARKPASLSMSEAAGPPRGGVTPRPGPVGPGRAAPRPAGLVAAPPGSRAAGGPPPPPPPPPRQGAEPPALPVVALTAWQGLFDRARLQPGQQVLVHAAAGGVGHIAIQLAKWGGADVFATASSGAKLDIASRLGADGVINYRTEPVEDYVRRCSDGGQGFGVVFDTVGKDNLDRSFAAARTGGHVVAIAARSTHDLSPLHAKGLTLHVVFTVLPLLTGVGRKHQGETLERLARLADEGHLRPLLDEQRYTFRDAAGAHRRLESGSAIGKVVLTNDL
ncbi:zinc-dependent alcohol dehydrogenase family protein [Paenibacillus sp. GbtcB18]|uniref:zinc-dependent alcohol dehydrogenase family protein n=1 Tax=Paenibacillus sp. GbtcB18 TaxID=2824763 RepID=UPI0020C66D5D|nr:zinc-dependent alcohol dehydrogenase family protein [Paenibacillus sp. GbtcB18]